MIIESISVCGFLGIGNTEKFQCQTEISKENKQLQNISHIKDSIFIKAFSIIFDSKFGAGCEMSEFINDDVEKPFVEVVLLQKDKTVLCDYIWLKDKQLVLTRYLKQPNQIFINGNKLDVSVFHQTISSLGYISFGSFQMHLLLDDEITRLRHFSGDDLWNLILKMNECEDLVNIIGKKHRMRQSLNNEMVKQMKDMEEALAEKLKSRNEIFSHLKLKRKFNTLMAIANKRKMKILRKESEVINNSLEKLEMELNYKHKVILDYKAEESLRKHDLLQQQSRLKLIQKERKDLQMKIFKSNNSKTPRTSEVFLEHRNRLVLEHQKTVNLIEELEASIGIAAKYASENFYQTHAQVEATKWKLSLKEAKDQAQRELNLKQLNIELNSINLSISYFQQSLQETTAEIEVLKTEAMNIATLDLEQMNSVIKLNNDKQTETEKKILEINVEIFKHQEKVLDIDREIAKDAVEGQVHMTCVKTMSEIEALVNKYPNLSSDYLGPVFQYLKADPELEIKMWGRLKTVANIFLFLRGSTARRVNRLLVDSGMKMGSYILLGIDEYVVANQEPRNTELAEKIKSAELLVPEDVKLKKVLKRLLRDLILINEEDLNFEMISFFPKLIVYNSSGTTTYHSKFFSLESSIPSYAQDENMSPISVLQKIYINVKKRLDLMKKIEFTKQVKLAMEQLTLQEQKNYQKTIKSLNNLEAESSAIVTFQQISTAFAEKADLESRCRLKQKKFKELTEVVKDISLKIETWDVLELKETEKELKLKLKEEELKLTEKTDEIAIKNKKLKNSIEIMENLKQFLTDTLDNTTNLGELFECIGNNKDSFIATCQEHLNEYNSKLMMNSEKIRELVGSSIDDTQHEEDLLKARCRLYEKNSERDVIINAVKQCEKHTEACKDESNFDQALYIKLRHESRETIMNEIDQCMKKIWSHKQANGLDVVSKDHYGHLVEAIKKVEQYCESPDQLPVLRNKIAARTYPVISKVFVKMLKDAVHNYRSAFNFVMSHFIKDSTLLFYTHGLFDEVSEDNFSWNCFELGRLKAMDFAVKWKRNGEQKIASATQRLIKGLLLILYIISYLSVFKFIIIHDKIFEEIDEILKEAVLKLLEVLSQHMQIIIITSDSKVIEKDSVTLNEPQPTVLGEPMDVSAEGE